MDTATQTSPGLKDQFAAAETRAGALIAAAKADDIEKLTRLWENGADLNSRGEEDRTALQHAAGNGKMAAVKWLLEHKADPALADKNGETPLHWLCSQLETKQPHFDILRLLVAAGAPVNAKNKEGGTAVIRAAGRCKDTEPIEFLIEHGARIDVVEPRSRFTALIVAAIEGRTDTVRLLLDKGQDVNQRDAWGRSLLWHAASVNRKETVELLLSRRADVFVTCDESKTPRKVAAFYNHPDMAARMAEAEQTQSDRIIREGIPGGVKPMKKLKLVR